MGTVRHGRLGSAQVRTPWSLDSVVAWRITP
jgi:hypothetical protein